MSAKAFLDTNIIIYGYSQDEPEKNSEPVNALKPRKYGLVRRF